MTICSVTIQMYDVTEKRDLQPMLEVTYYTCLELQLLPHPLVT